MSLSSLLGTDAPLPPRLPTAAPIGPSQTSGLAVTSLVLGILSCSIIPLLPAIPAVICGHLAKSNIRASAGRLKGDGMALAGLITGYLSFAMLPIFAILAGIALPVFGEVKLRGTQTKSLSNAKQIGTACLIYATDNDGAFPKTLDQLVPDYLPDRALFIDPLGPGMPMGYEYFGGKESDPADKVLLINKTPDRRGRRVVIHVNGAGAIEKYPSGALPSH